MHCPLTNVQSPLHPFEGQSEQVSANWAPHDTRSVVQ